MNVCAIDSATETLGICLKTKDDTLISLSLKMGFKHARLLVPWLERLLEQASLEASDLDLVVCSIGPGSFTGLRIGLATAKGLAHGAGCPIIGIPTLDVLASGCEVRSGITVPVIDAKKNRFYAALYERGIRTGDYLDIGIPELLHILSPFGEVVLTGPAAMVIYQAGKKETQNLLLDPGFSTIDPSSLLRLGESRFEKEQKGDIPTLGPLYLRKSEAEIKKGMEKQPDSSIQ
ncbi:MAG: tRNA (adenosine(37)-N6)-threonylcarbamoyltransferase complex dimerization subunit type 1 TsaB [Spirochaetales bacterium]|nr:tRNA (adenosine(37)-N6)-threonylcarbamoyltransferase complex dimerization subunit type 1 TsaB [Spirochaetales bacterium]